MRYLTADEIIDLNRRVNSPGGVFVVRDQHRVEYLVEIVRDDSIFPTVWDKAAMYLHRLATSQAFVDGNKRTALESADVFLELNGYIFEHPGVSWTVKYMLAIARGQKTRDQVKRWLRRHCDV